MNPSKALSRLDDIIARLGKFKPIRAYHGSPHSFSRFDSSKIGTGEGAQAYAHGLYFAGNEKVASDTRDGIMAMRRPMGETLARGLWSGLREGLPAKADNQAVMRQAIKALQERIAGGQQPTDPFGWSEKPYHEAIQWLSSQDPSLPVPPAPAGHMYEVDIALPEELFLDWDAPVGSQPKAVQDALAEFANAPSHFTFGQERWRGKEAYMTAAERGVSKAEASRFFRDRGIPGVRYLDQGSRAAGEGTRNYVVFPGEEDAIKILRKYGFLPPVAAAAMGRDGQ